MKVSIIILETETQLVSVK